MDFYGFGLSVFCKIPLPNYERFFPFISFTDFPCQIVIFHQAMAKSKCIVVLSGHESSCFLGVKDGMAAMFLRDMAM